MAQYCHASHEVNHEGVAQRAHNLTISHLCLSALPSERKKVPTTAQTPLRRVSVAGSRLECRTTSGAALIGSRECSCSMVMRRATLTPTRPISDGLGGTTRVGSTSGFTAASARSSPAWTRRKSRVFVTRFPNRGKRASSRQLHRPLLHHLLHSCAL